MGRPNATHVLLARFDADDPSWQVSVSKDSHVALLKDYNDGWVKVARCADDQRGAIPTAYLRPVTAAELAPSSRGGGRFDGGTAYGDEQREDHAAARHRVATAATPAAPKGASRHAAESAAAATAAAAAGPTHVVAENFVADPAHAWQLDAARGTQVAVLTAHDDGWCEVVRCADERRGALPAT